MPKEKAHAAGVGDRISFEVAGAKDYPGKDFDLVAFFDCLHDMGDPAGAAGHVRSTLKPDDAKLLVEPAAGDKIEDNSQSGRSRVLCRVDDDLHAGLGNRRRSDWRWGPRPARPIARRGDQGRLHPFPPRGHLRRRSMFILEAKPAGKSGTGSVRRSGFYAAIRR